MFIPARNKLEAVARISQLTNSGPETLGPGSKERRSVLENLAKGLHMSPDSYESKQELASAIAKRLNVEWTSRCESVGQTITLIGLNLLLGAATEHFREANSVGVYKGNVAQEVQSIKSVLSDVTPKYMDGRESVLEMKEADADNWRQTEWQGWYFEFKAIPALINTLGGGPRIIGNTKFDYSLIHPWDLKAHSSYGKNGPSRKNNSCLLNDQISMKEAAKETGLGLIVLSGAPSYEDNSFSDWHKALRGKTGEVRKQLKNGFKSEKLEFFFFEDFEDLQRTISQKILIDFKQGKQPSGEPRAPKFSLQLEKARKDKLKIEELNFS